MQLLEEGLRKTREITHSEVGMWLMQKFQEIE
jgi:hypothetical protein